MAFGKEKDLTTGSIRRYTFTLGVPVMLGMGLQQVYALVDLMWVGRLGPDAIAAVSLAGMLFFIFFSFSQMLGAGTLAIVANDYGRGDREHAVHTVRNVMFVASLWGAALSVICLLWAPEVMKLLGGKDEVIALGAAYLEPFGVGFFFQMTGYVLMFAQRGSGDMRTSMMILFVSTILNMVLDPFLIYGWWGFPKLGVAGAGWATLISISIATLYLAFVTISGRTLLHVPFTLRFKPDWRNIAETLKIGVPAGIQFAFISFSVMLVMKAVAWYGMKPVAALGTSWRLLQFATVPVMGLGAAVSTLVGQNLGAGKIERAKEAHKYGVISGAAVAAGPALLIAIFPDFFMSFFTKSPEIIVYCRLILRVLATNQVLIGINIMFNSTFSGAGDNTMPMIAAGLRAVVLVGLAYTLPKLAGMGLLGVWVSMPVGSVISLAMLYHLYRKGRWQTHMKNIKEQRANTIAAAAVTIE